MSLQGVLPRHGYFPANMQDGDGAAAGSIFNVQRTVDLTHPLRP